MALHRGASFEVSTPITSIFTKYPRLAKDDPRKRRITVKHVLTMTSGLDGDDEDPQSPGSEDRAAATKR